MKGKENDQNIYKTEQTEEDTVKELHFRLTI